MVTPSKRAYASTLCLPGMLLSMPLIPWQATVNPRLHWRPQTLIDKSDSVSFGVTAPFSWVLQHIRKVFSFQEAVSPVLWKFWNQFPLIFKVTFPEDSQFLCQILRFGSLLWGLELSQQ